MKGLIKIVQAERLRSALEMPMIRDIVGWFCFRYRDLFYIVLLQALLFIFAFDLISSYFFTFIKIDLQYRVVIISWVLVCIVF